MKLIKEVIQYYKTSEAINCPYCGTVLQFGKMNFGRESINVSCQKCGLFEQT